MDYYKFHHQFNSMPLAIADTLSINGVISINGECIPVSLNPASLYISALFLARAEKARMLCDLGKAIVERKSSRAHELETKIANLDSWLVTGCRSGDRCFITNALTIRTRRSPSKVTKRNIHQYLGELSNDSFPHEIDVQFKFFVGDYGPRVVLFTTQDLHYLGLSVCSGVVHRSAPYPHIDYLCQDALGSNAEFLKNVDR